MGRLARELEGVLQEKMELLPFDLPDDMGYVEALYEVSSSPSLLPSSLELSDTKVHEP